MPLGLFLLSILFFDINIQLILLYYNLLIYEMLISNYFMAQQESFTHDGRIS